MITLEIEGSRLKVRSDSATVGEVILPGVYVPNTPAPAPDPPPAPAPPAPAPPPAPPPAPALPADIGVLHKRALNPAKLIYFRRFHSGGRYTRAVENVLLPRENGVEIDLVADSRIKAQPAKWHAPHYALTCDGVTVGTFAAGIGKHATCAAGLSAVKDGWHLFDVVPSEGDETPVPFWMHVGEIDPNASWAPSQSGSYSHSKTGYIAKWAKMLARVDPVIARDGYPLAPRAWVPMGHSTPAQVFRRDLVPGIDGDPSDLWTPDGRLKTCLGTNTYSWAGVTAKFPRSPLHDGPRGVGKVAGATHLEIGRRGGVYGLDSWRMFHVDTAGRVRTLLGWRHGDNGLELVGDWSAIPAERHGLHEAWGLTWDKRTVAEASLDTTLPKIDRGDGKLEFGHGKGPAAFIADSQNNRILRAEAHPRSHAVPVKVTEFITGLADPWDVVYWDGLLYVSERGAHRIAVYDATTAAFVETIVQGQPLSAVDKHRIVVTYGTLEQRRAEPCVGPEGLFILGDWLYYGSRAAQRVKRINLVTRVIETACDPYFDISPLGSQFCKIAVRSDETVLTCTWEVGGKGGPRCYKKDGTPWVLQSGASSRLRGGRGGNYGDHGYNTACAADDYRVICGGADRGIVELSLALPDDPPAWTDFVIDPVTKKKRLVYEIGESEYEQAGYRLTHGVDGYGWAGYPLPWGKSANIDYYLAAVGHVPPTAQLIAG